MCRDLDVPRAELSSIPAAGAIGGAALGAASGAALTALGAVDGGSFGAAALASGAATGAASGDKTGGNAASPAPNSVPTGGVAAAASHNESSVPIPKVSSSLRCCPHNTSLPPPSLVPTATSAL